MYNGDPLVSFAVVVVVAWLLLEWKWMVWVSR